MIIHATSLNDALIIEPKLHLDNRGYFCESFNEKTFQETAGIPIHFVQDNIAKSVQNVLRGLHFQKKPRAQSKLISCIQGAIWDVIVDIRKDSTSFGKWFGIELSSKNKLQLFVPKGFAHGYAVLSNTAEVFYKCDDYYSPEQESGLYFLDETLNIDWKINIDEAILSEKDKRWPQLTSIGKLF